jgi:hypothetical protein
VGYVDGNAGGWTELRVHGVAGTAVESVLEHPHAAQVAGNRDAGFFRRLWEAPGPDDTARRRREAYSWGGLTSGDNTRALWLLLLPFMLLNVAFYMTPYRRPPGSDDPADRRRDRVSAAIQRLLALSFTATFTLTVIGVAMDLVGWQCAAGRPPGGDVCGTSWLSWLTWAWMDEPGRQVAVTALFPLAVAGLLWGLAGSTWNRMESVDVPQAGPGYRTEVRTPLEDRALWNGRATVRRLRSVHVATALTLPGVFAVAPLGRPGWPVLAAQLVLLAAMVVLVIVPRPWSRETPATDSPATRARTQRERAGERRDRYRRMPVVALGLTGVGLVVACVAETVEPEGTLPWLVATVQGLFVVQAGLLLALLGVCARLAARAAEVRKAGGPVAGAPDPAARPVETRPVWRGVAMPAVAMLAWVLAGGLSAGVVLRVAQTLGTPVARGQRSGEPYPLVVPTAYQWVAVGALVLGVVAVLAGLVAWWRVGRRSAATVHAVEQAYGAAARANPRRRDEIARAWARAGALRREAERALGVVLAATVVVLVAGVVGFVWLGPRLLSEAAPLVTVASLGLTGFVVGLLAVGRQAYRSAATRRTVGIVWDLGTFWPRAVHPLAPPCYAERALPDLMYRLRYLTTGGRVLLSCHSQGSVLGAALLLQVERPVSARIALLTYGAPLARLYGRFFPVYFSEQALTRLGGLLANDPDDPDDPDDGGRATWRWRNLHRPSDPIGGAVFVDRRPVFPGAAQPGADPGDVDRPLLDPVFPRAAGDPCYPRVRGHSRYFADPVFAWTTDALQRGTLPRRPQ